MSRSETTLTIVRPSTTAKAAILHSHIRSAEGRPREVFDTEPFVEDIEIG